MYVVKNTSGIKNILEILSPQAKARIASFLQSLDMVLASHWNFSLNQEEEDGSVDWGVVLRTEPSIISKTCWRGSRKSYEPHLDLGKTNCSLW